MAFYYDNQTGQWKPNNRIKPKPSRIVFQVFNYILLVLYIVIAAFPLLHLGAVSLSSSAWADAGMVTLIPRRITFQAYMFVFSRPEFFLSLFNSAMRLILGVPLNVVLCMLAAYPLSRPKGKLAWRTPISWFFIITMLFSGGLVPSYMLISALGLTDTIFALILPGALPVFNMVLMINFFRQVPEDMHEAAEIDGASEPRILFKMYVPLSLPSVITVTLFCIVAHWNSWLDGILYLSEVNRMPLQAYLQSVVVDTKEGNIDNLLTPGVSSQTTVDAARLFLAVIPVAIMYFPLQKYFIKGLTLGGVKG